jgi:hypothetical protein
MDGLIKHSAGDENKTPNAKDDKEISAIFQWSRSEIDRVTSFAHGRKQKIIKETALKLEGKISTDTIAIEIIIQLRDIVSPRLIHGCLDDKYKQKYRSENAKKQKKTQDLAAKVPLNEEMIPEVLLDAQSGTLVESLPSFNSTKNNLECPACRSKEMKIMELEDTLQKTTQLSAAENLVSNRKTRFTAVKDLHETMIAKAFQKCNRSCDLIFNAYNVLEGVKPDTLQGDYT